MATASVQTEEIRIDRRLAQLPEHLRPSAITSRPPTPSSPVEEGRQFTPVPGNLPPRNPRRLLSKTSVPEAPSSPPPPIPGSQEELHDAYPGNNDDGPLSNQRAPVKRPHRISSLFAGFDGGSSDEVDEFMEADMSDSEFRTALSAPRPKGSTGPVPKASKRHSSSTWSTMSPEQVTSRRNSSRSSMRPLASTEAYASFNLPERRESLTRRPSLKRSLRSYEKSAVIGTANKVSIMRKAAMIQSGIATHQGRARSPSIPDARDPPFPIPTRASSRRPPISASAPSDGARSPTRSSGSWHRRGSSRSHYRANSIRKVRSAAAIPVKPRYKRNGSRSPPLFPEPLESPESPGLPPLPFNDITTPRNRAGSSVKYRMHSSQPSTNTAFTSTSYNDVASSTNNTSQSTGVVDAIAQTMVGEWMFKYVRRRKSFGVPEASSRDENSNDRHKRWVWLAPYERAILWSSKQPNSNSTLMGKPGRKFTIQSVLDVKDDNPSPKGATGIFNRSILILTPQRALNTHQRDGSREAAEPPYIPRFHERNFPERGLQERANNVMVHGRKRSNTGGHVPPPLSFRGFSGPAGSGSYQHTATNSVAASIGTAGSSDIYQSQASSAGTWAQGNVSGRTSEASSRPANFFDAIGTVRMEAFISPLAFPRLDGYPNELDEYRYSARRRSKERRRRNSRSRNRDSYNSRGTRATDDWSRAGEDDFSRKKEQQKAENAEGAAGRKKKVTAAQLRVQKDLSELSLGSTMKTEFPDPDDILNFILTIEPDEGMYRGGVFTFTFAINQNFPHEPPKVRCREKIYHPNIDLEGKVCLNILREDWKPVLNLNAVIVGLQFLFLEPNASDPLNKEAADDLRQTREMFKRNVRTSMGGGSVKGVSYDKVSK
ncbi:unnamed protein product [Parascedosporium putredinis]|uniref:NEDD8-conjugating enzyme UBC12 n=1 Tax=Parascedosporium putredinis TaxID=1442378 RepID=A0A9P1H4G8_9PEZI|nr:unnamed protein product [Parascedosporium putredinis]CAI7995619.1 unnamed protein product [Parascedosporium putredinis]